MTGGGCPAPGLAILTDLEGLVLDFEAGAASAFFRGGRAAEDADAAAGSRGNGEEDSDGFYDPVRTPKTPHPGSMSPAPPPGEPPSLLRNKRPKGLWDESPPSTDSADVGSARSSVATEGACRDEDMQLATAELEDVGLADIVTAPIATAAAAASSDGSFPSSMVSVLEPEPELGVATLQFAPPARAVASAVGSGARGSGRRRGTSASSSTGSSEDELGIVAGGEEDSGGEEDRMDETHAQLELGEDSAPPWPPPPPPAIPRGPPPAQWTPPPPAGPPPSLPLDRAELKRIASAALVLEEGASSDGDGVRGPGRQGKRLRAGPAEGPGHNVCEGLEESYMRAPASARWVWDRVLRQSCDGDGGAGTGGESGGSGSGGSIGGGGSSANPAAAAMLERRMLQALDSLSVTTPPSGRGSTGSRAAASAPPSIGGSLPSSRADGEGQEAEESWTFEEGIG